MKWNLDRAVRTGWLVGLGMLMLLGICGGLYIHYQKASLQKQVRGMAESFAMRIAQRVNEAVGPVYILSALIKRNHGSIPDFDRFSADLLPEFPLANALELAPAGVVQQVYPLRGNEAIIGHDLLKDKGRNKEAHLALSRRQLLVAGPFDLIQGGLGAVVRYPVFLQDTQGKSVFWGFTIVLIHLDELLANAGEMELKRKGINYQLCKMPPETELPPSECKGTGRAVSGEVVEPLVVSIDLPNAQWQLLVAPGAGWVSFGECLAVVLFAMGGALSAGLLAFGLARREGLVTDSLASSVSV
jgi:hypothetical protein